MGEEVKPKKNRFKAFLAGLAVIGSAFSFNSNATELNTSAISSQSQIELSEIENLRNLILSKGYAIKEVKIGNFFILSLYQNGLEDGRFENVSTKIGEKEALKFLLNQILFEEEEFVKFNKVRKELKDKKYNYDEKLKTSKFVQIIISDSNGNVIINAMSKVSNKDKKEFLISVLKKLEK